MKQTKDFIHKIYSLSQSNNEEKILLNKDLITYQINIFFQK